MAKWRTDAVFSVLMKFDVFIELTLIIPRLLKQNSWCKHSSVEKLQVACACIFI